MPFLRQSTIQTIRFGPFLDATDGVAEEESLTITQALRRLSKDGGAFAQSGETGNSTHDSDGWYSDDLTADDTDTVGELILNVQIPATALPVWMRWWVLEEAVYDAIYGAAATGPLQPTVAGRTLDVLATGEAGVDLGNVTGELGNANVSWINANDRVDLGQWRGVTPNAVNNGAIVADVQRWLDTAVATPNTAGVPLIDLVRIVGGIVPTPTTTGILDVNTERWADTLVTLGSGAPDVNIQSTDDIDLSTTQKASVNVEALDVMATDTIPEPSAGVPPITPTHREFVQWMWAQWRNDGEVTSSERRVLSSADVVLAKAPMSDDSTTFSPGEMIAP